MSEYTTRKILDMIEANGGPERLNLSGRDLSFIDLSYDAVQAELCRVHQGDPEAQPVWWCPHAARPNLRGVNLRGANLRGAELQATVLVSAVLDGACAVGIRLEGADLTHASVGADLKGASLRVAGLIAVRGLQGALLFGADLEGAILRFANLAHVNFLDVKGLKGAYLYRARLDSTQLTKTKLGSGIGEERQCFWSDAREAYLALKNNFEQIGRYDDASGAYRKERRMEKRETWRLAKDALQKRQWGAALRKSWKVGWDLVVEYLCDYGESVGRVLGWMGLLLFVAGPLLFGLPGLLDWSLEDHDTFFSLRSPQRYGYAYLQQFLYVLDAFTTANFAELQPATAVTRVLSGFVALLGVFLTGLLGFVAGNRIRRS